MIDSPQSSQDEEQTESDLASADLKNATPLTEEPVKKTSKKTLVFGLIFFFAMTAVVLTFLFNINDVHEIWSTIRGVRPKDLWWAIACLIVYVLICPLSLCILSRVKKTKTKFIQDYLIGASEHFFNGITPYQTGAQPFQIFSYSCCNVKAGDATGIIIANFIAFLTASNGLMLFSLIYAKDFFGNFLEKGTLIVPIIGFIVNLLTLVMFICLVTCNWVRNGLKHLIHWIISFRIFRGRLKKVIPAFDNFCDRAQSGAKEAMAHPAAFFAATGVRLIALLFWFAIPFFILRSLGIAIGPSQLLFTILGASFATNAVGWVPTPGTSGGIEFSFTVLFAVFAGFNGAVAAAAAILWRALTYYAPLLISFCEYLLLPIFIPRYKQNRVSKKDDTPPPLT